MKLAYLIPIILSAALFSACASRNAKTNEAPTAAPAQAAAAAKPENAKTNEAPTAAPTQAAAAAKPVGEIVGQPSPGSKFAKVKLGMTLKEVEKLIGPPTKQWRNPTGKVAIPFYFGPDRWVVQYSYKGEGKLTFNYGGKQLLTGVVVNKAE